MTEHHRFQDATICRCTSQSEDSDWADGRLDHVIFTPICLFYISTRRSSRRHNVVDLEAALICIALKMGQQPETGLLFDKRAQSKDVVVSIVSYIESCIRIHSDLFESTKCHGRSQFCLVIIASTKTIMPTIQSIPSPRVKHCHNTDMDGSC